MKKIHITFYIRRGDQKDTTPLLGGITIEAGNISNALLEYKIKRLNGEDLPEVEEIKYIIEL